MSSDKKPPVPKTNALRMAETAGVLAATHAYEVDDQHLDAAEVARRIGMEEDRVFKTLLAWDGVSRYFVFVIPGSLDLDLKKAGRAAGLKTKVDLVPLARLTEITGYQRGGCCPLGMKKPLPTWVDETALLFETIICSAGLRGLQMELPPDSLVELCKSSGCPQAAFADLT